MALLIVVMTSGELHTEERMERFCKKPGLTLPGSGCSRSRLQGIGQGGEHRVLTSKGMRRIFMRIVLTGLLLFFLGCDALKEPSGRPAKVQKEPHVVCPGVSEVKAHHIFLVILDRSGSCWDWISRKCAMSPTWCYGFPRQP